MPWLTLGLVLLAVATLLGWRTEALLPTDLNFFAENGWVETNEALVLLVMAALFSLRALNRRDAIAFLCGPIATCAVLMAIREVPRCDSAFFEGGLCIDRRWKTAVATAALLLLALFLALRRSGLTARQLAARAPTFWPLTVSLALLLLATFAEHRLHVGIEESLELAAYLNAVLLGCRILQTG